MRKHLLAILFLSVSVSALAAQRSNIQQRSGLSFLYDVDFVMNFDNREIHHPYEDSQTLFGVRLTPTVGLGFNDSIGGTHKFMAGVSYVQPFGAKWRDCTVTPTVYYQFSAKGFRLNFGFVPYDFLTEAMPDYLRSDSLAFAYPNIQGILFQYRSKWGYADLLCDWRGMMSPDTREAFRIVGGGKFRYEWLFAGGWAQLNHLSHNSGTILGVCDDIVWNPLVGVSLGHLTPLDSLSLQVGYIGSFQRDRRAEQQWVAHGFYADFVLSWRFIGLRNEFYYGDNQMPLYPQYRQILNQGDPRYQARIYNRTDIFFYLIRRSFVTAYAGWNLLYLEGHGLSHQQQVVCRFSLEPLMQWTKLTKDERLAARKKGTKLRTLAYR